MKEKIKKPLASLLSFVITTSLCLSSGYLSVKAAEDSSLPQNRDIHFGPYAADENDKKHDFEPSKEELKNQSKSDSKDNKGSFRNDRILIKMEASKLQESSIKPRLFSSSKEGELQELYDSGIENLEPIIHIGNGSSSIKLPGGKVIPKYKSDGGNEGVWLKANVKDGLDVNVIIDKVSKIPGVISAEPDYLRSVEDIVLPSEVTDPQMSNQWYLNQSGIKEAWNYLGGQGINPGGSRDVVVAVIDTGVDLNHPDLVGNIWTNSREVAGNGVDDDNNGFIDDIHGASTVGNSYAGESGNPMDDNGHGTHVAGIIAAEGKNGKGITGVAYNVQIMPIKAAQSSGMLSSSDIAQAIYYAVDKGADIINMSFGGYGESTIEEDALQTAFGNSVLVASAGNDAAPNLPYPVTGRDMFPAAYPWVIGVMAEGQKPAANGDNLASFSNWDYKAQDSHEYEVMAPGVEILSTLPGQKYASWSGTSMSAPVVSGIAALLRSKFPDKNTYSSRFIMGQIVSTGVKKQGITYLPNKPPMEYYEVNAFSALTKTPKPEITISDFYIFDTTSIDDGNNSNGVVEAGETVDIAQIIRNRWGKADDVVVTMDTNSQAGIPDPYVTFINDTVNYGAVGSFSSDDNGLIYDELNMVTGVSSPFKIKIARNTPNDHLVKLNVTVTAKNGFDSADSKTYNSSRTISFIVRNATELPRIIDKDMTLTNDNYWLIPDKTLIEKGVTVTVEPGTQIQFWSADPSDPYSEQQIPYLQVEGNLKIQGTADEPVDIITGEFYKGYEIKIREANEGKAYISYAKIANPSLEVTNLDHCYFYQDLTTDLFHRELINGKVNTRTYWPAFVIAENISNSRFYKVGYMYNGLYETYLYISGELHNNLFDSCILYSNIDYTYSDYNLKGVENAENNVFLKNYQKSDYDATTSCGASQLKGWGNTMENTFYNNAILNNWLDTNVEHWMRFFSYGDRSVNNYLQNNYWGQALKQLIDKSIVDYNDDFNTAKIIYDPILTTAPETAYPFVVDAYVSTEKEEKASKVAAEKVILHVKFNRDMDKSVQPQVSFGPDEPYTDYSVKGDWVDARHWQGSFNINPLTGDGYQFIRVKGAQASNDPWLITGNDSERFRFEIVTSGTESMNLQASGGEGKINLSWSQDDFDTLAGYNIYRSDSIDGEYIKINPSIIPKDSNTYVDKDVQPGKSYFYKFTVVKTDMTESDFSNAATASVLDTIAPVINHDSINSAVPGLALQVYADVTDNVSVTEVNLYYRKLGNASYNKIAMTKTTGDRYSATIEGSNIQLPGIEYYIEASDGISIVRNGSVDVPNKITISDKPKVVSISPAEGSSKGGTEVVINGTNFKNGAKVTFDGVPAASVTVESPNKIKAVTPAHYPATVNVTVTNSDGSSDTLLQAFKFNLDGVQISIPSIKENKGHTFEVPINIENVSGLTAADILVSYDKDVLNFKGVRLGAITKDFSLTSNSLNLGKLKLSMASSKIIDGSGALVFVEFEVKSDSTKISSALNLDDVKLNSGAISVNKVNGSFTLADTHSVSGSINYFKNYKPISSVELTLEGNNTYNAETDINGNYKISGIEKGAYTLTPNKDDEIDGISAYDASLILQSSAGLIELNNNEKLAADVDGNNTIDSMDASYVLKKAAGLINTPFPVGKQWIFSPSQVNIKSLTSDLANQNLTGILVGDVSGSWNTSADSNISSLDNVEFRFGEAKSEDKNFIIPLIINLNDNDLYSAEFTMSYDKSKYVIESVDKGDISKNFISAVNLNTPGQIKVAMASAAPLKNNGVMLNIKVKALDSLDNTSVISINSANVNENNIKSKIIEYLFGDINKDGKITSEDSDLLKDLLLGNSKDSLTEDQLKAADVDEDGKITSTDYAIIKRMINGKVSR